MSEWKAAAHAPMERISPNVFRVLDPSGNLPRQMVVAKLSDGSIFAHSVVCTDAATSEKIAQLGELKIIAVPSAWHRKDAPAYRVRFPQAKFVGPHGGQKKIEAKVALDATYDAFICPPGLSVEHIEGSQDLEGVWRIDDGEQTTLVFNDLIFNLPKSSGLIPRLMGSSGAPKVTPLGKMSLVKDKAKVRAHLQRLAAIETLTHIVPGHGDVISHDAPATLLRIAAAI